MRARSGSPGAESTLIRPSTRADAFPDPSSRKPARATDTMRFTTDPGTRSSAALASFPR